MDFMGNLDYVVLGLYFLIILGIGIYSSRSKEDTSQYFLANRNLGWFVIGASLFASNIGSEHLIALSESGFNGGVIESQYEILAAFMLLILGWVFVPFYKKTGVTTMPEFLEKRFSSSARMYLSVISIVAYVITKISVTIFAGAIVCNIMLGIPFWSGAIFIVVITGLYTVFGGLKAVMYTDTIQMFVLIGGSLLITMYGFNAIDGVEQGLSISGGWNNMVHVVSTNGNEDFMSLWRDASSSDYPWTAILYGAPILGIWYWCTDQVIVQRVLAAKDETTGRKATIFAGFLKLTPLFIFLIPGIIAYTLVNDDNLKTISVDNELLATYNMPESIKIIDNSTGNLVNPPMISEFSRDLKVKPISWYTNDNQITENEKDNNIKKDYNGQPVPASYDFETTATLPTMVMSILPAGLKGLVAAGILSALMSSLSSVFNSCSTLITFDIYKRRNPNKSEKQLVRFGQIATFFLVVSGILWIPFQEQLQEGGLFKYIQQIQGLISPPIAAVFLFGLFFKRLNSKGAMTALYLGAFLGINRLILTMEGSLVGLDGGGMLSWFVNMHFLHYALFVFLVCSFVMFVVSYATKAPNYDKIKDVIYDSSIYKQDSKGLKIDKILTYLLILCVIVIWYVFS